MRIVLLSWHATVQYANSILDVADSPRESKRIFRGVSSWMKLTNVHRSFVPLFLRSFVPSFNPSFLRSFVPSLLRSFVPSFLRSFVPSFLRSFVLSFLRSFVPSIVPSISFLRAFVPSFVSLHCVALFLLVDAASDFHHLKAALYRVG